MINIDKPCEGIDYVIESVPEVTNEQAWKVVMINGQYKGVSVIFGNIQYNGVDNKLIYKMTADNADVEDVHFKEYTGQILEDIIKTHLANGTLAYG